jgi:hypothetical protein
MNQPNKHTLQFDVIILSNNVNTNHIFNNLNDKGSKEDFPHHHSFLL